MAFFQSDDAVVLVVDIVGDVLQVLEVGAGRLAAGQRGGPWASPGAPTASRFPTGSPDEQVSQEGELTVGHVLHCKTRRQTLSVGSAPCSALGQH